MWFVVAKMTRPSTEHTPSSAFSRPLRVMLFELDAKSGSAASRSEGSRGAAKATSMSSIRRMHCEAVWTGRLSQRG